MIKRVRSLELKWKLMVPFVLLTLLWAMTGTYMLTRDAIVRAQVRVESQLQSEMLNAGATFSDMVATQIELVRLAANTQGVTEALAAGDLASLDRLLRPLFVNSRAEMLVILDAAGQERLAFSRLGADIATDPADLPRQTRDVLVVASAGNAQDKVVLLTPSGKGVLLLSGGPVRAADRHVGTLAVANFSGTVVKQLADKTRGSVALYGDKGVFVSGTPAFPKLRQVDVLVGDTAYRSVGDMAVLVGSLEARRRVVGRIALAIPTAPLYAEVRRTALRIALLGMLAIFGVAGLGLILARAITSPLESVSKTAIAIAQGDLSRRANVREGDEIGMLGAAFNEMADRLQKSYSELEARVEQRTNELRRANEKLARVGQAKSDFLANMSHELRTPLNAILGYSELLADPFFGPPKASDVRKQARAIHTSGQHLLDLINDVLDLSKIEAGKLALHWEQIPVRKTIRDIVAVMQPLASAKDLKLKTKLTKAPETVEADERRMRQILLNLLSNAIKFTPQGGSITIEASEEGSNLIVSVTDTGIGIPLEFQERVFEQFLQVDGSHARKQEGTGLGLALTKRLVEMHGGRLHLSSEEGKGSTFRFSIPLGLSARAGKVLEQDGSGRR